MPPDAPHELTMHRVCEWGEVRLRCSVCGPLGKFQTAAAAYEHHATRMGRTSTPNAGLASICRGASLYRAP